MYEKGYIYDVRLAVAGSYVTSDTAAGATVLAVEDAVDFAEGGGTLTIKEVNYEYVSADMDTDTITLAAPLPVDLIAADAIEAFPRVVTKEAAVIVENYEDALSARVPHALHDRLPLGIRDDEEREYVGISDDSGDWTIVDVFANEPTIDGGYLGSGTVDTPALSEGVTNWIQSAEDKALQALLDAAEAFNFAQTRNKTYRQDDEPTGGTYVEGDIWFDTNDGNAVHVWNGTAWVDADNNLLGDLQTAVTQAQSDATQALADAEAAFNEANAASGAVTTLSAKVDDSVKTYEVQYAVNSSETTAPTSGWSTAAPTRTAGTFIWTRTVVTYQDNTTSTTSPALLTGNTGAQGPQGQQGPQGSQGIQGPAGSDGQTYYTWVKYADSPTTGMSDSPTGKTYMGLAYNKTTATESSNYSDYAWSLIKGADGAAGSDGKGISNTVVNYAKSTNGTTAPTTGWGTSIPATVTGEFLWTRTVTTYTDNSTSTAYSVAAHGSQGPQGTAGTNGNGITGTTVTYQKHTDGTTAPTGTWLTTIPATSAGEYLWTRTVTSYNTGSPTTAYSVAKHGETGQQGIQGPAGADGTPRYTWIKYSANADGTGMVDTPTASTVYIGIAYNKTTATESTVKTDYEWSLIQGPAGTNGTNGTNGISVTSVTPYYRTVTTGSAAPAAPTTNPPAAPWTATEPAYTAGTELYRTERIVYSDNTFAYTAVSKVSAYTAAVTAITAANGKNKIVFSTGDATGTSYADGDIWYKKSGTTIVAQWEFISGAWQPRTLSDAVLSSLSVGKLVGGDVSAITINIKSTGVIKSDNWAANSTGWKLDSAGLEVNGGSVTGALVQSTATASRGIKLNNAALIAYDGSGNQTFSVTSATGAVAMKGELKSGSTISGALLNGPLETTATANRGVKVSNSGIYAYDSVAGSPTLGQATFAVDSATGAVTMKGALTSGSSVTGATVTGGLLQTTDVASRGIKINSAGFASYDNAGAPTLTIDGATGAIAMKGTLTSGSSITGADISGSSFLINSPYYKVQLNSTGLYAGVEPYNGEYAAISSEGFAEFWNDVIIGGDASIIGMMRTSGTSSGNRIEVKRNSVAGGGYKGFIEFYSGNAAETSPGVLTSGTYDLGLGSYWSTIDLYSPELNGALGAQGAIRLGSIYDGEAFYASQVHLDTHNIVLGKTNGDGSHTKVNGTLEVVGSTTFSAGFRDTSMVGEVRMWAGANVPSNGNWLACNGGTFSSTQYPELAAILGDTYGVHSGTTYYLPDMRRRLPMGPGTSVAVGRNEGVAEASRTPAHTHTTPNHSHGDTFSLSKTQEAKPTGSGGGQVLMSSTSLAGAVSSGGASTTGAASFDTVVPYLVLNFIIRAR